MSNWEFNSQFAIKQGASAHSGPSGTYFILFEVRVRILKNLEIEGYMHLS
jgi:hypothetical protein